MAFGMSASRGCSSLLTIPASRVHALQEPSSSPLSVVAPERRVLYARTPPNIRAPRTGTWIFNQSRVNANDLRIYAQRILQKVKDRQSHRGLSHAPRTPRGFLSVIEWKRRISGFYESSPLRAEAAGMFPL
ncbi:uncharacterized protein V6R79_019871 [Siganus canaliculatus]